jgi:hypothetical protein
VRSRRFEQFPAYEQRSSNRDNLGVITRDWVYVLAGKRFINDFWRNLWPRLLLQRACEKT